MDIITSRDNPRIKHVRNLLSDRAYRREHREYVIEGARALDGSGPVKRIYAREGTSLPETGTVPLTMVSAPVFSAITDTGHSQGIIGIAELRTAGDIARADARYVLCDRLQDPGNMGTVLRSACAFGMRGLILLPGCVDPFSPKVVRASAGTLARMEIVEIADTGALRGTAIIAADAGGTDVRRFHWPDNFVLALGNEGAGISPEIRALASATVSIPIKDTVESLNAGVAAGILLFCASNNKDDYQE